MLTRQIALAKDMTKIKSGERTGTNG
jgi:hypothetical protein